MAVHTVTSAEDTASTVAIDFADYIDEDIVGAIVQAVRSGKVVTSDAAVSFSGTVLTVADGTSYTLTADDVLNIIVY